jgi:hypothetical protein
LTTVMFKAPAQATRLALSTAAGKANRPRQELLPTTRLLHSKEAHLGLQQAMVQVGL